MKAVVFLSFPDDIFLPDQKRFKYFSIKLQMKALKSLLTGRCTKSGSVSNSPKLAFCGFKIGRSKLH